MCIRDSKKADEVLQQAVQGITDLINLPALIKLDFADVQLSLIHICRNLEQRQIIELRFGVNRVENKEVTQKEVAEMCIRDRIRVYLQLVLLQSHSNLRQSSE